MIEVIKLSNVCYHTTTGREIINGLSMSIRREKVGIVGRNGVGKSTVLKIIAKIIEPTSGEVKIESKPSYVPQVINYNELNIKRILMDISENIINNTQNTVPRKILKKFRLDLYDKKESFEQLSGGEARMLLLMQAFLSESDVVILDEPESDLDIFNRELLRELLLNTKKAVLIVSHDQKTLLCVDSIVELREQGVETFGGNYYIYLKTKEKQDAILDKNIKSVSDELEQIESTKEKVLNSQEYRMSKGREDFFEKGYGDFWCDTPKKDRAAKTLKKLMEKHEKKINEGKRLLESYISNARIVNNIKIPFEDFEVNKEKVLLSIESLYFSYGKGKNIFENFNLWVCEGEKIWLYGKNGAGKTTLIKLIQGKEMYSKGSISIGDLQCAYCGQKQEELEDDISLIDAICKTNNLMSPERAGDIIQASGFPLAIAQRLLGTLSGGERIIAALIIALSSKTPPRLLLLDEPTNHLDLQGIRQLQIILKNYKGAIIIATHDEYLMEEVGGFRRIII